MIVPEADKVLVDYDVNKQSFGAGKHSIWADAEEKRRYVNRVYDNFLSKTEFYKDINEIEKQRLLACKKIFNEVASLADAYQFHGKNEIPMFTDLMSNVMFELVTKEVNGSLLDISYKEVEEVYVKHAPYIREFAKKVIEKYELNKKENKQ